MRSYARITNQKIFQENAQVILKFWSRVLHILISVQEFPSVAPPFGDHSLTPATVVDEPVMSQRQ